MDKARFLIEAHLLEGRSVAELAAAHDVHPSWIYRLLARYREGGLEALEPRSRRPHHSPSKLPDAVEDSIVELRKHLGELGVDAGAETIHAHLSTAGGGVAPCSVSTVMRVLRRRGFVVPQPHKRPKSSYLRFEAALPNECWQTDMTHVELAGGQVVEVLNILDDYSRLCIAARVFLITTAADVVATFYESAARWGFPASVLSDNGAIFTASARGDRGALATELAVRGIVFKHGKPYHPETQGKIERFHQTLKKYLDRQDPPATMAELQGQLDRFVAYYNEVRPHRARNRMTPAAAYAERVKARPSARPVRDAGEFRIRNDRVDREGKVTLRYGGKLRHLSIGRAHKGRRVMLLVNDRDVRVLSAEGDYLCSITIDPERTYQARRSGGDVSTMS